MRKSEILRIRLEHMRRLIFLPKAKTEAREQRDAGYLANFRCRYVESAEPGQIWLFPSATFLDPRQVVRHTAIKHVAQAAIDA
ncbi:MAG: hypothetical protein MUF20_14475 [Methylotetracoccus sp.]|jgi:hypothetical protein|nr:hypothetical protein [Methylotetracoccus sp.]